MDKHPVIQMRLGEAILLSKGLVLVKLREDNKIEIEDAMEHIRSAELLSNGSEFVSILDGGITLDVSDKAMYYSAKHVNEKWLAFAIIVRSISERLFANYYLKFKRPVRPTKVFTTPKGAEEWLKQYIKIEKPLDYDI